MITGPALWTLIVLLGIGTYLIRLSFLGLIGDRPMPPWVLRCLRFVPVAVIPAIAAPLVVWPDATGGAVDPARLIAAGVVVWIGLRTQSTLGAIAGGAVALYLGLAIF
ncbi:MAG: AzlD domain-containing protein [Pseudomonadota bacterium]